MTSGEFFGGNAATSATHASTHVATGTDPIGWGTSILIHDIESNRPSAASVGGGPLFFATDTGVIYKSTGSAWVAVFTSAEATHTKGVFARYSMPRGIDNTNIANPTSGVEYMVAVPLYQGDAVTTITFMSGSTAWNAGTGTAHLYFTLRKPDGTLVATTADAPATTWGATLKLAMNLALTAAGAALTPPYAVTVSGDWLVGIVAVPGTGGVVPTLRGIASQGQVTGAMVSGTSILSATNGSAITDPSTLPAGPLTPTAVGNRAIVAVS